MPYSSFVLCWDAHFSGAGCCSGDEFRSQPSTTASDIGNIACGHVVGLVAQTGIFGDKVWYQASNGWVHEDVVKTYGTEIEAKAGAQANGAVCAPPVPTATPGGPSATPDPRCDQPGQPPCPTTDPNVPTQPPQPTCCNVTIVNNSACNVNGSLRPAGFSVGANSSAGVTVPPGRHTLSGSGDICTVGPTEYDIQGDATITLS